MRYSTISKKKAGKIVRLAQLPLTAAVALTAMAVPSLADPARTFYSTRRHTYCDLKLLARFWGVDTYRAKVTAGRMMERGEGRYLPGKLAHARNNMVRNQRFCGWGDADNPRYSYNDAVMIGRYWRTSVGNAKGWVGKMLYFGRNRYVLRVLRMARAGRTYR
jgi:hypothetical protein